VALQCQPAGQYSSVHEHFKESGNQGLLSLLRMKRSFLCIQLLYELFNSIKGWLIGDKMTQAPVALNHGVDRNAPLAHRNSPHWRVTHSL
jgi:hypothetical protein